MNNEEFAQISKSRPRALHACLECKRKKRRCNGVPYQTNNTNNICNNCIQRYFDMVSSLVDGDDSYECETYNGVDDFTPYGVTCTNQSSCNDNVSFSNDSLQFYDVGQKVYDNEFLNQYEAVGNSLPDDNFVQEIYGNDFSGFYEVYEDGNLLIHSLKSN
ncbi:21197_t:CDS:2 [Cetraspora pellucida]|uniref:21197_t:CDS:1 n=1 Tax=Cetraspora pellucida TaxID=1433469 RepID=A0A9N9CMZ7_9GLOM|nr:21197_t:CDS:2 [Cetraspora pellucida]